jgi:hypothetical protein
LELRLADNSRLKEPLRYLSNSETLLPSSAVKMIASIQPSGYNSESNVTRAVFSGIYKKLNKIYNEELKDYQKNIQAL